MEVASILYDMYLLFDDKSTFHHDGNYIYPIPSEKTKVNLPVTMILGARYTEVGTYKILTSIPLPMKFNTQAKWKPAVTFPWFSPYKWHFQFTSRLTASKCCSYHSKTESKQNIPVAWMIPALRRVVEWHFAYLHPYGPLNSPIFFHRDNGHPPTHRGIALTITATGTKTSAAAATFSSNFRQRVRRTNNNKHPNGTQPEDSHAWLLPSRESPVVGRSGGFPVPVKPRLSLRWVYIIRRCAAAVGL